jgi:uncharacterized membrane-anchored protein YhcB (DUF1043 family)
LAYEELFLVVGIISVLAAVFMPFLLRGLSKGEKQIITSANFTHLQNKVEQLSNKTETGFAEATKHRSEIVEQYRRDMRNIYDQLAATSSDIRLHTNQISQFCIQAARIEDRLRKAEMEIIRNERSRVSDRRSRADEINGS